MPANVKSVAFLLTPAIGDTIVLQALLREIRSVNPKTKIALFAPKAVIETARLMQFSDEVFEINITDIFKAVKTLHEHTFDLLIDAGQWTRLSALIAFFSGASHTRGFQTEGQFRHYVFDSTVMHQNDVHEVVNFKNLLWLPAAAENFLPQITLAKNIDVILNRVVIHMKPGGAKPFLKEWPLASWNEVVSYLLEHGFEVYFTGSAADRSSIENFISEFSNDKLTNSAGKLSIPETAELLKSASLVISVNTGIMHLASALNSNLIALHGPTNYKRWGPLNTNSISIKSPFHQAPCLNLGFEYACNDRTGECMKAISPDSVIQAIEKLLPPK